MIINTEGEKFFCSRNLVQMSTVNEPVEGLREDTAQEDFYSF